MSHLRVKSVVVYSDSGARAAQEDYVLVHQDKGIFVIADGFGGPGPGFVAARTACESVRSFLIKEAGDREATLPFVLRTYFSLAGNILFNAVVHANRKVRSLNRDKDIHERGGASLLAGYLDGDLLALAGVGGCTAWLCRNGRITELVVPRTYGRMYDPFSAQNSMELSVPLTAVGMSEDLEPEIFEYRVREGDWLLFHTDGLTAEVRERIFATQLEQLSSDEISSKITQIFQGVPKGDCEDNMSISLAIL